MRFLKLAVQNLGVFRDYHYFDLAPKREPEGGRRPLTVISGSNGVGKSTLFQALLLGLYGQRAAGDRLSRQAYSDFLLGRLHRYHIDGGEPTSCDQASVALTLQYVESGTQFRLDIERSWERKGTYVVESLRLRRDGEQSDLGTTDYQAFINDLIPPGLGAVCFFDAEQMDALSNPESTAVALADALQRLLGIDVVDRLIADLDRFTSTRGGGERTKTRLKADRARIRPQIEILEKQVLKARAEFESLSERQRETEHQLADRIRRLAEIEGTNTNTRPVLQAKGSALQKENERVSEQLRDMCAELFPFALAPALCNRLSRQLEEEAESRRFLAADALWRERVGRVEALLANPKLWDGIRLSDEKKELVSKRLLKQLGALKRHKNTAASVHPVSDPERERLQGWISQVLNVVPEQVRTLGGQLERLKSEQSEIEIKLQQLPDEDVVTQANEEIFKLEALVSEIRQKETELVQQIGVLQFKRDEAQRQFDGTGEQLRKHREADLAARSKTALRVYKDALTRKQTVTLEERLVSCFNRLCRKEQLLGSVKIDPSTFNVELSNPGGLTMALSSFSAGERHLFALAMLWALRQAGGRQLPLVIDTPLARLDDVHRHRLIDDYVSSVSDQVVFFATDAELDDGLLTDARSHLARVYKLNYDEQAGETVVIKRDFTSANSSLVTLRRRS